MHQSVRAGRQRGGTNSVKQFLPVPDVLEGVRARGKLHRVLLQAQHVREWSSSSRERHTVRVGPSGDEARASPAVEARTRRAVRRRPMVVCEGACGTKTRAKPWPTRLVFRSRWKKGTRPKRPKEDPRRVPIPTRPVPSSVTSHTRPDCRLELDSSRNQIRRKSETSFLIHQRKMLRLRGSTISSLNAWLVDANLRRTMGSMPSRLTLSSRSDPAQRPSQQTSARLGSDGSHELVRDRSASWSESRDAAKFESSRVML